MIGLKIFFSVLAGYILGSLNTSVIVGKFYGVDVRQHGSGNAGATNTLRTLGKKAAIFVSLGDLAKGIVAYVVGCYIFGGQLGGLSAGTAAIVGHMWPVFFYFKGGKSVLTTFAVLLMIDWAVALGLLGLFIIIVLISRYVSLGSIIAVICFPMTVALLGRDIQIIIFAAVIAILITARHHSNIRRLFKGEESKLSFKKTQFE